jgi:hypothetical protein
MDFGKLHVMLVHFPIALGLSEDKGEHREEDYRRGAEVQRAAEETVAMSPRHRRARRWDILA